MTVLIVLVFFLFPLRDKAAHWLLVVGFIVRIPKSDVNDGVSITLPFPPNQGVSPSLLFSPPMTYLVIRSAAALTGDRFTADAVLLKGVFF